MGYLLLIGDIHRVLATALSHVLQMALEEQMGSRTLFTTYKFIVKIYYIIGQMTTV